jgi:hypothetical protein
MVFVIIIDIVVGVVTLVAVIDDDHVIRRLSTRLIGSNWQQKRLPAGAADRNVCQLGGNCCIGVTFGVVIDCRALFFLNGIHTDVLWESPTLEPCTLSMQLCLIK